MNEANIFLDDLYDHLETKGKLHPSQFGFRRGKAYLADLDETITETANKEEHCKIVVLNIKKAYDRVWHRNIMESNINSNMG